MTRRALVLFLLLASCGGDDAEPAMEVPAWAHVAPEQLAEAKRHGVLVAFENHLGMRFVLIPAGSFRMGTSAGDDGRSTPQHEVTLTRPFYLQVTEVSNRTWRRFRPDHDAEERARHGRDATVRVTVARTCTICPEPYGPELDEDPQPASCVSWHEAQAFAEWLSQRDGGRAYRLPTEAEWEYACRAGTTTRTAFAEALTRRQANVGRDRFEFGEGPTASGAGNPVGVGRYRPNRWGLHDMHGNVHEWCADWFAPYGPDPLRDPAGPGHGTERVVRGGCARTSRSAVDSAARWKRSPDALAGWGWVGLRLVSPVPEPSNQVAR